MNYLSMIDKYYSGQEELKALLLHHSRQVADKALIVCAAHPEWNADTQFVEEAAMLHDIGIIRCNAPSIHCHGAEPYICHGRIGADLLREEGFARHARVAERHTGSGLTRAQIIAQGLPLPAEDFVPETIEEKVYTQNRIRIELFWLRVYWYEKRIRMSNWFEPNRSQRSQE